MDGDLQRRLNAINRSFYRQGWRSFVARRQEPWPGWSQLLTLLRTDGWHNEASVLDLGCAHGRFATFLDSQGHHGRYLGIDSSPPLVLSAPGSSRITTYVCGDLDDSLNFSTRYDLVVAFGLLHHIPGREARLRLVEALATRVVSDGHLVVTLWNPDDKRRQRATAVDGGEPGDALLPWGVGGEQVRYCHFFDDDEVGEISTRLGDVRTFRADGRSGENHYLVHRSSRGEGESVE